MSDTLTPISNPEDINRLAAEFLAVDDGPTVEVTTARHANNLVTLPGGFINSKKELVRVAEIRELTGVDEEELAKAVTPNRVLQTAFTKGIVSLGGTSISFEDVDSMLSGDRDAVLLGIRALTFGAELPIELMCPSCQEIRKYVVDLDKDIPKVELADPLGDRTFSVRIKAGEAVVILPTGRTAKRLLDADDMTLPELVTTILTSCLISLDGTPSLGVQTALNLGIVDREKLISEIYRRNPGPRLGEVKKACEACGADIPVALSLAALFRV